MPDKVIEATAVPVERPKRPEMWAVLSCQRGLWVMSRPSDSLSRAHRKCAKLISDSRSAYVIHIEAEQ